MKKLEPAVKCPYCGKEFLLDITNEDIVRFIAYKLKVKVNVSKADS